MDFIVLGKAYLDFSVVEGEGRERMGAPWVSKPRFCRGQRMDDGMESVERHHEQ